MRLTISLVAGLCLTTSPTFAKGTHASVGLYAVIPATCSVDVIGSRVEADRVSIVFKRTCNTAHEIKLSGPFAPAEGGLTVRFNGGLVDARAPTAVIHQPEDYYERFDEVVLAAPTEQSENLSRYAASFVIDVNTI